MAKKNNVEEVVEVTEETVETVENTDIVAAEEPKEQISSKFGRGFKKYGPKIAKLAVAAGATVAAFVLGVKVGKSSDSEDGDIVDADYEVLDDTDDNSEVSFTEF